MHQAQLHESSPPQVMLPPTLDKHVLFFSNRCQFSKEVLGMLHATNTRSQYVLVCIEKCNNVPEFVDCVPLLLTKDSRILTEDSVYGFVKTVAGTTTTTVIPDNNNDGDMMSAYEFAHDISDKYSFVDEFLQTSHLKQCGGGNFFSLDMLDHNGEFPIICKDPLPSTSADKDI